MSNDLRNDILVSMKKHTDKPVTHEELKNALDEALTKTFGKFVGFVSEKFEKIDERFEQIDERFEQIDQQLTDVKDRILTSEDKIVKRLDNLDADNAAGMLQGRRLTLKVDNHEKRISSLESKN